MDSSNGKLVHFYSKKLFSLIICSSKYLPIAVDIDRCRGRFAATPLQSTGFQGKQHTSPASAARRFEKGASPALGT